MDQKVYDMDRPIVGCEAIGEFINETPRRATDLCVAGAIPAYKLGKIWHLPPRTYLEYVARLEAEALAKGGK